jgi:uncharacterized protein DUF955
VDFNPNYQYLLAKKSKEESTKHLARTGEVQRHARAATIEAGCETLPTDLYKLARFLGVNDIREVPLAMRGRLLNERGRLTIEVNKDLSRYERRQTIAHELGHVLVEKDSLVKIPSRSQRSSADEALPYAVVEKLCDVAAAEILIPLPWLERSVFRQVPSLLLAKSLADSSDTTVEAMAARLLQEALWNCRFVFWRDCGDSLRATKSYPHADDSMLAWMEPEGGMSSLLGQCARQKRFTEGKQTLRISGERYRYKVQCVPLDDTHIVSLLLF